MCACVERVYKMVVTRIATPGELCGDVWVGVVAVGRFGWRKCVCVSGGASVWTELEYETYRIRIYVCMIVCTQELNDDCIYSN